MSGNLPWCFNGSGKLDTWFFYQEIRDVSTSLFPWKGIWKVKAPKMVAFFMWTTAYSQIISLDNFMLRGLSLANWCCMCGCNEENVIHLLLLCPTAHTLWVYLHHIFGIHWVMPGSVVSLLFCWWQWVGKHNSDIWNLVSWCLMWIIWMEWNRCTFENIEKSLVQLQHLFQQTLLLV